MSLRRLTTVLKTAALSLAVVVLATVPGSASVIRDRMVVPTESGAVRGVAADGVENFLGMPYAKPPVDGLRWRPPRPASSWDGVRPASEFGSPCAAMASADGPSGTEEDCLFLNVQRPTGTDATDRLPVYVYIHGGGLRFGSSGLYNADKIVRSSGAVTVTFNYRLGMFGFLGHPALTEEEGQSGNYGFLDQQAALRWVQRNIAAFGGDPERVTIGGESAGGWSVCSHLASPASRGLFAQAVIQSGSCHTRTQAEAEADGGRFAALVGCGPLETAARCLRQVPPGTIVRAGLPFSPAIVRGAAELPVDPRVAVRTGEIADVPVLIGSNLDEGRLFTTTNVGWPRSRYADWVRDNFGSVAEDVLTRYPWPDTPGLYTSAYLTGDIQTDAGTLGSTRLKEGIGGCGTRDLARDLARYTPTYVYEWAPRGSPGPVPIPGYVDGAVHAAENGYLFPRYTQYGVPVSARFGPGEWRLSDDVTHAWGRFVTTGRPSIPGMAEWPAHRERGAVVSLRTNGESMVLDDRAVVAEHQCAFWDALAQRRPVLNLPGLSVR